MQGGSEYENNDDVNDANVYVKNCDPVFNSFVAYLSVRLPGKYLGFFVRQAVVLIVDNLNQ